MNGVVQGTYICNQNRTQELNDRLYERNLTGAPIKMQYSVRSVPTRYVHMPMLDCRKPSEEGCGNENIYNTKKMFTPASSLPFNGYQQNVDVETKLRGSVFPLQACAQASYVPDSNSDLYKSNYLTETNNKIQMTNELLFKEEEFNKFNPNECNLGYKLFNNHTRVQLKNL
tara:strand:- start:132 stop:644 length:513 start_codon:yes stop_codon:yes gene_type:complete